MNKLIFGCGYLGLRVARQWLAEGHRVAAVSRSPQRAERFQREGIQGIVGDVTQTDFQLPDLNWDTVLWAVGYDRQASPTMREVYVDGLVRGLDRLPSPPQRVIYISSTGVYGQTDGSWVDETSPCHPTREGGKICLEAEQALREHPLGEKSVILRLAGIYGPGRLPRREDLKSGAPMAAYGQGYLNLIHVDDAATIVRHAERHAPLPSLYLVSDGHPIFRLDYYRYLAELLGAPDPKIAESDAGSSSSRRGSADKRISNRRMQHDLAVTLRYPSYREGLRAALEQEDKALDAPAEPE